MNEIRLSDKYKSIEQSACEIKKHYLECKHQVSNLLMSNDKSFDVTFKGVEYNLFYPSTQDEKDEAIRLKDALLEQIFKQFFEDMIAGKDSSWMLTAFAAGTDPLDMQIEIVKSEVLGLVDDQGNKITAIPLDQENYQVKQELEYDIEIETLDL